MSHSTFCATSAFFGRSIGSTGSEICAVALPQAPEYPVTQREAKEPLAKLDLLIHPGLQPGVEADDRLREPF